MRHIVIQDFGPIKQVDLCLDKPLQVVIGPQASGKSTLGKTIYFCRKIRDYLVDYAQQQINSNSPQNASYTNFLKYLRKPFMGCFGTTKHMDKFDIVFYYNTDDNRFVQITLGEDHYARFRFSESLRADISSLIKDASNVALTMSGDFTASFLGQTSFLESFKKETCKIFCDEDKLLYIPAGRNLLATIPDLIQTNFGVPQNMGQNFDISQVDLITQEFIQYIRQMRNSFGSKLDEITKNYLKTERGEIRNKDVELAANLIRYILKADYVCDKDGEKLFYEDGRYVKLMFGSSGQQEILWALNIIYLTILKNEKAFLVFEEPESHLFPDSQETIAQLVSLMINSSNSEVFLTTHSPYMLTSINLLIYSGRIEKTNEAAIIERQYRLKPTSVAAYLIPSSKGVLRDLISQKRGLIDATEIDHISDTINSRMSLLLQKQLQNNGGNTQ